MRIHQYTAMETSKSMLPFVKGFKPPTQEERVKALGLGEVPIPVEYQAHPACFSPIPTPTHPKDWLARERTSREGFITWLRVWNSRHRGRVRAGRRVVYLQPLGVITGVKVDDLAAFVSAYYPGMSVQVLPQLGIDVSASGRRMLTGRDTALVWRSCHEYDRGSTTAQQRRRGQYQTPSLLTALRQDMPEDAYCVVGITLEDLYEDDEDSFTVGIAEGEVAVLSFYRYQPATTRARVPSGPLDCARPMDSVADSTLLLQRSCKVLVHELGHLYGIKHCVWYECCMNGSGHLDEDYRQPLHFCPVCLHKVQHLTQCSLVQTGGPVGTLIDRYTALLAYYQQHGLDEEARWTIRVLNAMSPCADGASAN